MSAVSPPSSPSVVEAAAAVTHGTMSTITTDDTTSASDVHGKPYEGMCCLATMEDITIENGNYVEYQVYPSMKWKPCLYEQCIVEKLLSEQFNDYISRVKGTDCQAELRRLLAKGPPIWLADEHALPLDDSENDDANEKNDDVQQYVCNLWFASDNRVISAKLQGALEGQERQDLWNELRQFIIQEGKEKGDDDDDDDEGGGDDNNDKAADDAS